MFQQDVSNLKHGRAVLQDKVKVYRQEFDSRCSSVKDIKKSEYESSKVVLVYMKKLFDEADAAVLQMLPPNPI